MIDLAGQEWVRVLEIGLGAQVVDVETDAAGSGKLVIFTKGPLRVGYADFTAGDTSIGDEYEAAMCAAAKKHRVDVIRYQAPMPARESPRHARFHLETALIGKLQDWGERALEKPRRTSNRLDRTQVCIRRGRVTDARVVYGLYLDTIRMHGGSRRYTEAYFAAIAQSCWLACLDDHVIGFVATGRVGERGLYLHGGHRQSARQHYPSDLLFLTMLKEAKQEGLRSFDFLASPPGQSSLLNYKRAWGAEAQSIVVSDHPLGWRGKVFSFAYAAASALKPR